MKKQKNGLMLILWTFSGICLPLALMAGGIAFRWGMECHRVMYSSDREHLLLYTFTLNFVQAAFWLSAFLAFFVAGIVCWANGEKEMDKKGGNKRRQEPVQDDNRD